MRFYKLSKAAYSTFGKAPGEAPKSIVKTDDISLPIGTKFLYAVMKDSIQDLALSDSQSNSIPTLYFFAIIARLAATVSGTVLINLS